MIAVTPDDVKALRSKDLRSANLRLKIFPAQMGEEKRPNEATLELHFRKIAPHTDQEELEWSKTIALAEGHMLGSKAGFTEGFAYNTSLSGYNIEGFTAFIRKDDELRLEFWIDRIEDWKGTSMSVYMVKAVLKVYRPKQDKAFDFTVGFDVFPAGHSYGMVR